MPLANEINFDGLIGPTHNYAGLSYGNLASQRHGGAVSNPRRAALEGLAKMKRVADLGIRQAVLPPRTRPDLRSLRRLGFAGSDAQILDSARREDPVLLSACCSASSMWAANAATVCPSADACDGRVHFTPANLVTQFHRSVEAPETSRILGDVFKDETFFAHHDPLPASGQFGDEGAANHTRLAPAHGDAGLQIFVYGRSAFGASADGPKKFPARQTLEASQAIARLHQLDPAATLFLRQHPAAIDAGAFHNDVVAVGNGNVLFFHELAFADSPSIASPYRRATGREPVLVEVPDAEISLADAVRSYLFNSQLVTLPDGTMALICPAECGEITSTREFLARLPDLATPIRAVHFVDIRQSMNNGGGPACLRLRVVLTEAEQAAAAPGVFLTNALYEALCAWVQRHYRDRLSPDDLADPKLLEESRTALDELTKILGINWE